MTFRTRLSLCALEARDNPSDLGIDTLPYSAPPTVTTTAPAQTAPTDPTAIGVDAMAGGVTGGIAAVTPPSPILAINDVYKVPMAEAGLPGALPSK